MKNVFFALICLLIFLSAAYGQDPLRFKSDIAKFENIQFSENIDISVFTGSSSIRFWDDLALDCNQMNTINTGFGGSHMSDLLYYLDQTVLRFQPKKVFIYEGDNDIASGKNTATILSTTKEIVNKINQSLPETEIYFISAKPSPSRWKFEKEYITFNRALQEYCATHEKLTFIDVWSPMITDQNRPLPTIFVSDSLHMNRKGYILWKDIICKKL